MKNIQYITSIVVKRFGRFLRLHHIILFSVITTIALSIALWLMYTDIINATNSTDNNSTSNSSTVKFDDATIQQLYQLQSSSKNTTPLILPEGRINPFSEEN